MKKPSQMPTGTKFVVKALVSSALSASERLLKSITPAEKKHAEEDLKWYVYRLLIAISSGAKESIRGK